MKPALLLILAFTAAGCGEAYDAPETPYIVSIDPQPQLYDHDTVRHYSLVPYLIRLKQEDVRTITVTFSRAPELIAVGSKAYSQYVNPTSWELVGRELSMKVYCFRNHSSRHAYEHRIPVQWVGGGTVIRLWCEREERQ